LLRGQLREAERTLTSCLARWQAAEVVKQDTGGAAPLTGDDLRQRQIAEELPARHQGQRLGDTDADAPRRAKSLWPHLVAHLR
jgi:hypothetical protein